MHKQLTTDELLTCLERERFAADAVRRRLGAIVAHAAAESEREKAELVVELASILEQVTEIAERILKSDPAPHLRTIESTL